LTIHLDTSVLVDVTTQAGFIRLEPALLAQHRLMVSSIVFFEWRRGPRTEDQLALQEGLFPESGIVPFGSVSGRIAAEIFREVKRPRSRQIDIAIAASAIEHDAWLWTLNIEDFEDIPGLTLYRG
jgi:predicted nucleic acid-binding protein